MTDNLGLTISISAIDSIDSIDATLKELAGTSVAIAESMQFFGDEFVKLNARLAPPPLADAVAQDDRVVPPGTLAQGFLSGRWNRRDGNVYTASTALQAPNSPYEGGENSHQEIANRARQQRAPTGPAH